MTCNFLASTKKRLNHTAGGSIIKMKSLKVEFSTKTVRNLDRIPPHIRDKLFSWVFMVETIGLSSARNIRGFRDEALVGNRKGQRSIRLNNAYRAIYVITSSHASEVLRILEVNKHEY